MRPLLLDLFCGAGGAAMGYHRAGFRVVGVDNKFQKNYPFEFHQGDALEFCRNHGNEFDAIHASPPCQRYSRCNTMHTTRMKEYPDLIVPTRDVLRSVCKKYVIENVPGSPLQRPIQLCGLMFGLRLFRHRLFESNVFLMTPYHPAHTGHRVGENGFVCMAGHGDSGRGRIPADHRNVSSWKCAAGIDWMTRYEMAQAIPPAYTEFIGRQLMMVLTRELKE